MRVSEAEWVILKPLHSLPVLLSVLREYGFAVRQTPYGTTEATRFLNLRSFDDDLRHALREYGEVSMLILERSGAG